MRKTSASTPPLADLTNLAHTIAEAEGPDQIFAAVADIAHRHVGYKLFTIMAFDAGTMRVQRLFSSDPDAYPLGEGKGKRDTRWGHHVLIEGRPFIGRTEEDIRANFDDHQIIFQLGLKSILNIPVRIYGRTIGTINFLHDVRVYDATDVKWGLFLATQLIGPLAMDKRSHSAHAGSITATG